MIKYIYENLNKSVQK